MVPMGCVTIQSAICKEYLSAASLMNYPEKIGRTMSDIAFWKITKYGPDYYRLQNIDHNGLLYAAKDEFMVGKVIRPVFTRPGKDMGYLGLWDIKEVECGIYTVRDRLFDEYLIFDKYPTWSVTSVFTCRPAGDYASQKRFQWFINKCNFCRD